MYAISAFLLVAVVTLSSANPVQPHCKELPAKQNFNPNSFFKGTWYITHSSPKKENTACVSLKAEIVEKMAKIIYTVKEKSGTYRSKGNINLDLLSGYGKFETKLEPLEATKPGQPKFHLMNETVIDTDYENYAVVYSCFTDFDGPSIFNIISRNPNPDDINENVEKVLEKIEMKLSDFDSSKHLNCQKVE
ncbi:hypothetical protein O3M35_011724 [Rhynocoris fuscipes]|uniref:Uncharacterized protein n=1 Tax=Rhynocoris fuscipes TaxID=488301 RepID=A0AAW1CZ69_9HEMI